MTDLAERSVLRANSWSELPLHAGGRSLIEASAGTGKTWTISVLYLRLLLEPTAAAAAPLGVKDILVATFTDAAAQELRARIRERLIWAVQMDRDLLQQSADTLLDDAAPDQRWLLQRWLPDAATRKRDVQRLQLALAEIDVAPITTLHGLCLRILRDYPFESGSTFGLGEMISGDSVLNELADDLWRQLQQGPVTPPTFPSLSSLGKLRTRLGLCLRPGVGLWCPSAAEMAAVRDPHVADAIDTFAERKGIWALTETGRQSSTLKNALKALAKWIRDPHTKLTATQLTHLHNREALLDPGQCEALLADPAMAGVGELLRYMGYDDNADEIKAWSTWTASLRALRDERLTAAGRLTFDDLITRVHDALCATSAPSLVQPGNGLADRLFAEWKVALIDEFQDTDAQQYGILDRIYREDDGRPRGRLVMIGDPKQAIYRFRGGDIDAYRLAADNVDTCLELDTNFRSSRGYVDAVNEWFARAGSVLGAQPKHPIAFHPVKASARCDESPLQLRGAAVKKPLVLHYQPSGPDNADFPVAAGICRQLALVACANQIAAMLNDPQMRIGDARVAPKDIAVLLPTNPDIANLRHLLQARNVPCVGAGRSSVFQSDWALELQIVLYAVDNPADEAAVRAALATRLGGLDFAELCSLRDDVEAWQGHCARYVELRQKWRRNGVLAVVLQLAGDAMQRMPRAEARERAMTDLRHLGELLQQQNELLHGASQLLAWLADQRAGDSSEAGEAADEQQLRIESDAKRVRLMTLHASKGLEFPIVFLPLMWAHGKFGHDSTPVINERLCGQRVIGFGHDPAAQYDEEGQDERFRVLYVALTRAVHACHVYALHPSRLSRKGAKEPLQDPARSALDAMIARLDEASPTFEHIDWVVADWPQDQVDYVPPASGRSPDLQSLREPSEAPFEFKWSFSTLTKSGVSGQREEEPADDEEPLDALLLEPAVAELTHAVAAATTAGSDATTQTPHEELLALGFSRGAPFGNALHHMFETRHIGEPMSGQLDLIRHALENEGVRLGEVDIDTASALIAKRLDASLAAELAPGLSLGAVPAQRQRAEMEFNFVVDGVSIKRLRDACEQHGEPGLIPVGMPNIVLRGLMTGHIDLVFEHAGRFHVLDYKSNHLGERVQDYLPEALEEVMHRERYRFQALLYTIALERYLRQRMPDYQRDQHLGEAIYLFVRGAGLAPNAGVWRRRFGDALLDAVDAALGAHVQGATA